MRVVVEENAALECSLIFVPATCGPALNVKWMAGARAPPKLPGQGRLGGLGRILVLAYACLPFSRHSSTLSAGASAATRWSRYCTCVYILHLWLTGEQGRRPPFTLSQKPWPMIILLSALIVHIRPSMRAEKACTPAHFAPRELLVQATIHWRRRAASRAGRREGVDRSPSVSENIVQSMTMRSG